MMSTSSMYFISILHAITKSSAHLRAHGELGAGAGDADRPDLSVVARMVEAIMGRGRGRPWGVCCHPGRLGRRWAALVLYYAICCGCAG
jgi:hypothetical protein